jgi:hypothetical protein
MARHSDSSTEEDSRPGLEFSGRTACLSGRRVRAVLLS